MANWLSEMIPERVKKYPLLTITWFVVLLLVFLYGLRDIFGVDLVAEWMNALLRAVGLELVDLSYPETGGK